MEEIKNDIIEAAKCPVCLEVPRPDKINSFGMCKSAGHLVCGETCAPKLLLEPGTPCPVCKSPEGIVMTSHHYLANLVLRCATREVFYPCDYCRVEFKGQDLLAHEKLCTARKLQCPFDNCKQFDALEKFYNLRHPCFRRVIYMHPDKKHWDVVLTYSQLAAMKSGTLKMYSVLFLKREDVNFRFYLKPASALSMPSIASGWGLGFYCAWFDEKKLAPAEAKNMKVFVGYYTSTKEGMACITSRNEIQFEGEVKSFGFFFAQWASLENFARMSENIPCNLCNDQSLKQKSHLHLIIKVR